MVTLVHPSGIWFLQKLNHYLFYQVNATEPYYEYLGGINSLYSRLSFPYGYYTLHLMNLLKKIVAYITRSWEDEPGRPHNKMRILPPFFFDLLSFGLVLTVLYYLLQYLYDTI